MSSEFIRNLGIICTIKAIATHTSSFFSAFRRYAVNVKTSA